MKEQEYLASVIANAFVGAVALAFGGIVAAVVFELIIALVGGGNG